MAHRRKKGKKTMERRWGEVMGRQETDEEAWLSDEPFKVEMS
jgi:hypothetical protein